MAEKWKKTRFDWGAFSRMMTDVLEFQKKGLSRSSSDAESENISLRVYDWLQCPMDLNLDAVKRGKVWRVRLSRPMPRTKAVHVFKYQ